MDKNEKISIEVDKEQKYDFCKSVHNLRKFCLIDCHVREKEAIECDIYTWIQILISLMIIKQFPEQASRHQRSDHQ